ncbi:MAG: ATP-grasp domain-containing protein [Candidatus Omnitrophica bacterium]|nr:ATP-grasp domain-containing protein [Candidatus Omnitrophota bacterium]
MKKRLKICITCVGGHYMYDLITALRSADDFSVYIVGVDANPDSSGRFLVDAFEPVSFASQDPQKYINQIKKICRQHDIDAVIPFSEQESRVLSQYKRDFEDLDVKISVGEFELVDLMTDKFKMLDVLKKKGVSTGPFFLVESFGDVSSALKALNYPKKPVVLKQRSGSGSKTVFILDENVKTYQPLLEDRACGTGSLDVICDYMKKGNLPFTNLIAVPFYGHKVCDIDCVVDQGKAVIVIPRLREYSNPLSPFNQGCQIYLKKNVVQYVKDICRAFGVHGPCDYDIAIEKDGTPRLLDASCRLSGSVGASFAAGANVPAQLVRILFDLPRVQYKVKDGIRLRPYNHIEKVHNQGERP